MRLGGTPSTRVRINSCNPARLNGATVSRRILSAGSHPSTPNGASPSGGLRSVTSNPTGSSRNLRSANWRRRREGASIHWRSSIARRVGCCRAVVRRPSRAATDTARGSAGRSSGSCRSRATERAFRCGSGSDDSTSSTTPSRRSPSPADDSRESGSSGRAERMRNPLARATMIPADHKVVLPMPASPSMTQATGPVAILSRKPAIEASSASRPTIFWGSPVIPPPPEVLQAS